MAQPTKQTNNTANTSAYSSKHGEDESTDHMHLRKGMQKMATLPRQVRKLDQNKFLDLLVRCYGGMLYRTSGAVQYGIGALHLYQAYPTA